MAKRWSSFSGASWSGRRVGPRGARLTAPPETDAGERLEDPRAAKEQAGEESAASQREHTGQKRRSPREGPGQDETAPAAAAIEPPAALSVSALLGRVKEAMSAAFPARVQVVGEISNFSRAGSGHCYFRLKDDRTAIDCVMFRTFAGAMKFEPSDGLEVLAQGRVDVYEARGQLQLYVERLTPKGAGALELAFRQMRERLQREGLFDDAHKVPLPRFPRAVGVVTSATGAAVRDIARTLHRRWPAARMYLVPVPVQGDGAALRIAAALRALDAAAPRYEIDVMIVGRGGGSLEDLWAFNEEPVARAIYDARTPVISGVGHEVDVSIADLVADVRAPTPTAAAELAVPHRDDVRREVGELGERLRRAVVEDLRAARVDLAGVQRSVVFRDPMHRVRAGMQRVDELSHRLRSALRERLHSARRRVEPASNRLERLHPARLAERARGRLAAGEHRLAWVLGARAKRCGDALARVYATLTAQDPRSGLAMARQQVTGLERQLEALSYRSVLRRGFAVVRSDDGRILRSVLETAAGERIEMELGDGRIGGTVTRVSPDGAVGSAGASGSRASGPRAEEKPRGTGPPRPAQPREGAKAKRKPLFEGPMLFGPESVDGGTGPATDGGADEAGSSE